MFDLTSMQDATEICHYAELVGGPLRLELNFTFPLEGVMNSLYWENECLWLQLTSLVFQEKTSKMDNVSLQQISNRIAFFKYRYRGSFPSDYGQTHDNDILPILIRHPTICSVAIG